MPETMDIFQAEYEKKEPLSSECLKNGFVFCVPDLGRKRERFISINCWHSKEGEKKTEENEKFIRQHISPSFYEAQTTRNVCTVPLQLI